MSEVLTVALTTEEISEVLRVAARDGVWVCDKSVQLLCERNDGCCLLFQAAVAELAEA
jgi:hypothetical protein